MVHSHFGLHALSNFHRNDGALPPTLYPVLFTHMALNMLLIASIYYYTFVHVLITDSFEVTCSRQNVLKQKNSADVEDLELKEFLYCGVMLIISSIMLYCKREICLISPNTTLLNDDYTQLQETKVRLRTFFFFFLQHILDF